MFPENFSDYDNLLTCAEVVVFGALLLYLLFCVYAGWGKVVCIDNTKLCGKTVVITESDKGIGYQTALELASRQARVILACRNMASAEAAAAAIRESTGNLAVHARMLDVSSLASVRRFAKEIVEHENRVDILINNAGIGGGIPLTRTEEGFELIFATDYLGHFLLTHLLLDKMKKCAPSRIINVSSLAHKFVDRLDFSNLNSEKSYSKAWAYSNSKLAQILFTREMSKRLRGTNVTINALHPGTVNTNLFSRLPLWLRVSFFNSVFMRLFFKTPEDGAQTSIYLAVASDAYKMSGLYYSDCAVAKPSRFACDDGAARKLYELSEAMVGLLQDGDHADCSGDASGNVVA